MAENHIPMYGYSQPRDETGFCLPYGEMPKKPKEIKTPSHAAVLLRERVAENVLMLMRHNFPASKFSTQSKQEMALARAANISWSTVQRVLSAGKSGGESTGTRIDTLADLAVVFGVNAADLMTSNFAHDKLVVEKIDVFYAPDTDEDRVKRLHDMEFKRELGYADRKKNLG